MNHNTFWISNRLRLNGSRRSVNATGVAIAVTGIAIAVVIMEFTLAIVLGFKNQITERVIGFEGKLWVLPDYNYDLASSAPTLTPDSALMATIQALFPEADTYMRFSQPGIIKTDNDFAGIYFTGEDNAAPTFEKEYIVEGCFPDFTNDTNAGMTVISQHTAKNLGLKTGDKINACFFVNDAIKSRKLEISGIYETGFNDYDQTMAFASINMLRKIASADSTAGTRLIIDIPYSTTLEDDARSLQEAVVDGYRNGEIEKLYPVDNVRHAGAIYFNWLELLNTNVVAIIVLMICVAGFTLVSSMFIIILERIPTIGILRSLGSSKSQIRSIFIIMAMKIVGIGLIIGNAAGIGLLKIQEIFHVLSLDSEMYYLKYVPVEINWMYFLYLNLGVVVISWMILILPSRVASGISPAVTMRFE